MQTDGRKEVVSFDEIAFRIVREPRGDGLVKAVELLTIVPPVKIVGSCAGRLSLAESQFAMVYKIRKFGSGHADMVGDLPPFFLPVASIRA